jgi:hypothetical protein
MCKLTETTVRGSTCHSTLTHLDSELTRTCSYFLMLRNQQRSNKYQFIFFRLTRSELKLVTTYYTCGEYTNHITQPM